MTSNTPTLYNPAWTVWTTDRIHADGHPDGVRWCWAAYGPRGSESGAERTPDAATRKAQAAAYLLTDERPAASGVA